MKNLISTFILLFAFATITWATTHTVSNDPNNPAQFTVIQDAHDAASGGDTIYIFGSPTMYGDLFINKQLMVIGNGYAPVSESTINYPTIMLGITLTDDAEPLTGNIISDASGSHFIGLDIAACINYTNGSISTARIINNITIERCNVRGFIGAFSNNGSISNWLIKNCIIAQLVVSGATPFQASGFTYSNNIILDELFTLGTNVSVNLLNNLIFWRVVSNNMVNQANFKNNIFIQLDWNLHDPASGQGWVITNSDFQNNIAFRGINSSLLPIGENNNVGSGNMHADDAIGVNPLFVNFDVNNGYGTDPLDEEDYHLQASSPGKNAGTDGTDIGIYGGAFPWPDATGYTGTPSIPEIYEFEIQNPVVAPSGTLKLNSKVRKRN